MRNRATRVRIALFTALVIGAAGSVGACQRGPQPLVVGAAVSLREVLEPITREFAARHAVPVEFQFASSGTLERQIAMGAPIDVFFSASPLEVERLLRSGHVVAGSTRNVASNELVLAVREDALRHGQRPPSIAGLAGSEGRIAIGEPTSVPAGRYARDLLVRLKLWDALFPRFVFAASVRQALEYLRRGEVSAAFVYRTDVATTRELVVADRAPAELATPVCYVAAVVARGRRRELARQLTKELTGAAAQAALHKAGYLPPPGESSPARPSLLQADLVESR